ncbi:MAG: hypothetical protein U1D30_12170 [Planctomycetota bacterium]
MGKEGRRVNGFTAIVDKQSSHHAAGKGPSRRCPCHGDFLLAREDIVNVKRRKPYAFDGMAERLVAPPILGKRYVQSVEPIFSTTIGYGLWASSIVKSARFSDTQVGGVGSWW